MFAETVCNSDSWALRSHPFLSRWYMFAETICNSDSRVLRSLPFFWVLRSRPFLSRWHMFAETVCNSDSKAVGDVPRGGGRHSAQCWWQSDDVAKGHERKWFTMWSKAKDAGISVISFELFLSCLGSPCANSANQILPWLGNNFLANPNDFFANLNNFLANPTNFRMIPNNSETTRNSRSPKVSYWLDLATMPLDLMSPKSMFFLCFLNGFAMRWAKPLWLFCFFGFSRWFCLRGCPEPLSNALSLSLSTYLFWIVHD